MKNVKVDSITVGSLGTNCYFVCNGDTMETVIIDPGADAARIAARIEEKSYRPAAVFLTHGHFDHMMAAKEICDRYRIKLYIYEKEKDLAEDPDENLSTSFMGPLLVEADETFADNDIVEMAGMDFKVLHTPGHTKGSCCFYMEEEKILISGDTLFCQSVGRSDFPTGSTAQLLRSIGERLFVLPDETKVYPGHGDATTIGYEKAHNCCAGMV
ncbi:MAG: MBL fold metallo-hydrolase [Alistipes sp.]|nr:MBL fold metallo-hydrolase [Alistipes sp.]